MSKIKTYGCPECWQSLNICDMDMDECHEWLCPFCASLKLPHNCETPINDRWFLSHMVMTVVGKECYIWIGKRPSYCDRGNFLAHLEASGTFARDIDGQDLWPRYYMKLENAMEECELWLKKRNQWTEGVAKSVAVAEVGP